MSGLTVKNLKTSLDVQNKAFYSPGSIGEGNRNCECIATFSLPWFSAFCLVLSPLPLPIALSATVSCQKGANSEISLDYFHKKMKELTPVDKKIPCYFVLFYSWSRTKSSMALLQPIEMSCYLTTRLIVYYDQVA